ncbi:MAG: DNA primase [Dehalococcoidia bacterium]|nr:MAG: DNA primase [Dehalococcoidia bacterium]
MTVIDDVKSRLDIVEVVSGYVPELKKAGRTWKARCPFHSERTPSFAVDPERQTWHCFGSCSTGGDVIEFVRKVENLDFREALQRLAERAGVELRQQSPREREEREQHERLLAANEAAAVFWQAALASAEGAEARAYAERRGLDDATVRAWQLGFAPDGWRSLTDHLIARGFSEDDLIEAGLAIKGDRGVYDRFRYRLMFPTRDGRRRLIGFGARAMRPGDEPKYLNTPQTPLFDKSGNLYGLDRAGDAVRRLDRAVVVEGYMDVIACHQYGFEYVVASNGTSITEKQMALLKRYSHNVVLALDADAAGSAAALRGIEVAAGVSDRTAVPVVDWRGLVSYQDVLEADIRVVTLPPGDDPDSMVRRDPEAFRALLDAALPVADHLFRVIEAGTDVNDPRSRSKALQALAPTVAAIADPVIRSHYVARMSRLGQVDERTVIALLAGGGGPSASGRPIPPARPVATPREVQQAKKAAPVVLDGEGQLLSLLLARPEARAAGLELAPEVFEDSVNRALWEAWVADAHLGERVADLDELVRAKYEELAAVPLRDFEPRHVPEMVDDMARTIRLRRQKSRTRLAAEQRTAEFVEARRGGAAILDAALRARQSGAMPEGVASEAASLAGEFLATVDRMQEIVRDERRTSIGGSDRDKGE